MRLGHQWDVFSFCECIQLSLDPDQMDPLPGVSSGLFTPFNEAIGPLLSFLNVFEIKVTHVAYLLGETGAYANSPLVVAPVVAA